MFEQIKKGLTFIILLMIVFILFSTFANFVIEHQRLLARLERDNTLISNWRTMVSRNIKMLCSDHEKRCEVLPDPDPEHQD